MKKIAFWLLILSTPTMALAQLPTNTPPQTMPKGIYELDKTHASLLWKVSHMGLANYTARFTDFDATIDYDPKQPQNSTLKVSINPLSVTTDYPNPEKTDFDKELGTESKWLNGTKYPAINYTSKSIEMTGKTTAIVHGELEFLGVKKPQDLNVTFNKAFLEKPFAAVPALGFSATATVDRTKWGLDTYVPTIGKDVSLQIEVEFHKAQK